MTAVDVQGIETEFDDPLFCGGCNEPWDHGYFFPEKWGGDGRLYCRRCIHALPPSDFVDAKIKGLDES